MLFGVACVEGASQANLLGVVQAIGLLRFGFRPAQRRQEHARQNGDNGNDHQQLNQGKSTLALLLFFPNRFSERFHGFLRR